MVHLAREREPAAEVAFGRAEELPFVDGAFTVVTMSIVFFFLEHPVAVLRECRRVLGPGGRLAVYTTVPALRGTPAAPSRSQAEVTSTRTNSSGPWRARPDSRQ